MLGDFVSFGRGKRLLKDFDVFHVLNKSAEKYSLLIEMRNISLTFDPFSWPFQ